MNVLIIGGTGLISTGIVKSLFKRGADVTVVNRSKRENMLPSKVKSIVGDRNEITSFGETFGSQKFDCVIDMMCFDAVQAGKAVAVFADHCEHYIFCSTVCTYGIKSPTSVFIDESFPQEPISGYGKNKVAAERVFQNAHQQGKFNTTVIRPSSTYGPGNSMIDNLEGDAIAWDRILNDQPVLCAGDGLGLWVSTHRDDCGKLFAYAAMNPKTYGQSYNATRDQHLTWTGYYHHVAAALNKKPQLIYAPATWIVNHNPSRFGLLKEITAFHGAYSSAAAKRDVPEFKCEIALTEGAAETFADMRRRNAWKDYKADSLYQSMVDAALALGLPINR